MSMWRQRTLHQHQQQQQQQPTLGQLDPNASRSASAAANPNLSKQSLDFDRSESFLQQSSHHFAQQQQQQFMAQNASSLYQNGNNNSSVNHNVSMPMQHVVTEKPPPMAPNHRDRFQMYLERYAPHHAETALRRAQLITSTTSQQHEQQQQPHPQDQSRDMHQQHQSLIEAGRDFHQQQQQQQHPPSNMQMMQMIDPEDPSNTINVNDNNPDDNPAVDVDAHTAQVLDVKPDRLRFELCAARSEADQLRRRIVTLSKMNDHLQDKLRDTLLSEREQAVRANSIESQDRSLQERLGDAEAEVRELKRRLGESSTALSRSETQLAQCRGRLAAFDHIASTDAGGNRNGGAQHQGVTDSVTELVQTLSTSQYLLSVLSTLRFLFSSDSGSGMMGSNNNSSSRIQVHLGGGLAPMQVSNSGQALDALQALVCGNRETQSEMRTRVVGWTPDDMLREIRSVVMTAETMVVRLLTDGSVGSMIRSGGGKLSFPQPQPQQQQQQQQPRAAAASVNTSKVTFVPPNQAQTPQNLINYLAPQAVYTSATTPASSHQQQQHQQHHQQQHQQKPSASYDPMTFEQENTPMHQQQQPSMPQQRAAALPVAQPDRDDSLWLIPEEQRAAVSSSAAPTPQQQKPQPQPQQQGHPPPPHPQRRVLHPQQAQQQKAQQQQQSAVRGDTISNHLGKQEQINEQQQQQQQKRVQHTLHSPRRNIAATYEAEPAPAAAAEHDGSNGNQIASDDSGVLSSKRMRSSFDQPVEEMQSEQQEQLPTIALSPQQQVGKQEEDPCKVQ